MATPIQDFKQQFSSEKIMEQLPFLLFLFLLGIVYIYNNHVAETRVREINKVTTELKELKWEYLNTKNDLENRSMQTQVATLVDTLGLHELTTPPKKIRVRVAEQ